MSKRSKRYSVSDWALALTLACTVCFGVWLNSSEPQPHPIIYLNLGAAYLDDGKINKAKLYWNICSNYEQIYGMVGWKQKTYIDSCRQNLIRASVKIDKNDPLFKRGH